MLDPDDLTPRQRLVYPYFRDRRSNRYITAKTGLDGNQVYNVKAELRALQRNGGRRTVDEATGRLKQIEEALEAHGRCGVCGLLEPHVCIHNRATNRERRGDLCETT